MASTRIDIDLALNTKGFRPLGRINGLLGEFEKSLDASNARVLAFGVSAGAILAVKKAFTATVKAAIEVERSLKDINVILQVTSGNLKKFGSDLFKIASETGQAFSVAATAATELARQGLGVEETLKRTRDALILARLSGMDAAEAVQSLTAALNTFTKVGLDSTAIINKMANVDAAFAVSSDDLAKALGRVGASAKGAGVSLDQLLAIVTSTQQKTARGGAVIGNSFKTIFTRIQRPRVIKQLESLGVAVKGLEGQSLPALKVLGNLARQFDNLSESQRAQITELVGGVFQVNILKAAMSDLSKEQSIYNRALDISIGSSDQAIRRNEELNQTLAAQFQKTLNTFKEAAAELGTLTLGPAMENIFGAVNKTFDAAQGESGLAKAGQAIAKSVFEGIGKFIGGPGLIIIGAVLFKTFANLATFAADAFKTLTGLNKTFSTQLNLQKQIFGVLEQNPDLMNKIKKGTLTVEDAHQLILKRINEESSALERQLLLSSQIANQLSKSGVGFSPEFGAITGGPKEFRVPKTRGKRRGKGWGYVPNFAGEDPEEMMAMMAGGYSASQIKTPKIKNTAIHTGNGGVFTAKTNGYEDIVNFTNGRGKKSTAVVPPRGTDAWDDFMGAFAGGYVPNFAKLSYKGFFAKHKGASLKDLGGAMDSGMIRMDEAYGAGGFSMAQINRTKNSSKSRLAKKSSRKEKTAAARAKDLDFNVGKGYGVLSLYGKNTGKGSTSFAAETSAITALRGKANVPKKITISGFQSRGFLGGAKESKNQNAFAKIIRKHLSKPLRKVASDFAMKHLGLGDDAPQVAKIGRVGPNALLPEGAEGSIFEGTINALTKNAKSFEAGLGASTQAVWDFEESGQVDPKLRDAFGFSPGLKYADAKRTVNSRAMNSLANKIFSTAMKGKGDAKTEIQNFVSRFKNLKEKGKSKASGYIPNFNALFDAVEREKGAGVPMNKIRVGSNSSLVSNMNPRGLGVWNPDDERSLGQGIKRKLAMGRDPRTSGIPNFATSPSAPGGSMDSTNKLMKLTMATMTLTQATTMLSNAVGDNTEGARTVQSGLSALEKSMMIFVGGLALQQVLPEKLMKSAIFTGKKGVGSMAGIGRAIAAPFMPSTYAGGGGQSFEHTVKGGKYGGSQKFSYQKAGLFTRSRMSLQGERLGNREWMGRGASSVVTGPSRFGAAASRMGKGAGRMMGGLKAGAAGMGPLGVAAVGAAAYSGISTMANETFNSSFKELQSATKSFEKVAEEAEKNIGKLTKFGSAVEQAATTFNDSNATMGQVLQAQREMRKSMEGLPAAIRTQVAGMIDPAQIQSAIEVGVQKEQEKKTAAQTRKDTAQAVREVRKTDFGLIKPLSGLFSTANERVEQEGRDLRQVRGVADTAISTLSDKDLSKLSKANMADLVTNLSMVDPNSKSGKKAMQRSEELMQQSGMDQTVIDSFIKGMKEGSYSAELIGKALRDEFVERRKSAEEERQLRPIREAMLKQTRATTKAIKDHKEQLQLEQKIRKETIKITSKAAESFLTAGGKIELQARTKLAAGAADRSAKFGDELSAVNKAFTSSNVAGTGLGGQIQQTITAATRGGPGSVNAQVIEHQTAVLRAQAETATEFEKKGLEALATQLERLNATSGELFKEQQKQTYETMKIVAAQKAAAQQAIRLKSFGGSKSILDPRLLSGTINQITSAETAMTIGNRAGSKTAFNRGVANKFAGMQTLLGGELPPAMRAKAMAAATQVKEQDISVMNRRFGLGLSRKDIRQRASEQAAELFKGEPLDRNNKNLETLNATLMLNNQLIASAQNNRMAIGGMQQQASLQESARYQNFQQNKNRYSNDARSEEGYLQALGMQANDLQGYRGQMQSANQGVAMGMGVPGIGWAYAAYSASTRGGIQGNINQQQGQLSATRSRYLNRQSSSVVNNYHINGTRVAYDNGGRQIVDAIGQHDSRFRANYNRVPPRRRR